ncbi:hypothetical protein EDC96DRAFT_494502 [Choanephora cucurbitarum]|nr:hypothetical protein EDC96DRAFT_494502 [Choanephora cucurbitarum]
MSYSNHHMEWPYHLNNGNQTSSLNEAPLQEPVAFEDFQFSLGLDPNFSMPVPLDMMPPPSQPMTDTDFFGSIAQPPPPPPNMTVLDEQDHKAFDQFLDQFYVDPNMQIDPQIMCNSLMPSSYYSPRNSKEEKEEEEYRQSSILQSLDEHQRRFVNEKPAPPSFHQTHNMTLLPPPHYQQYQPTNEFKQPYYPNSSGSGGGAIRRSKPHKELLTEEEKRNNHIASEQKRRSMIRSGFKDLTEIVPTLKNINNSKSTVLFKAVDFIKYLEKRNKSLREKIKHLEVRVEVEGRMSVLNHPPNLKDTSMKAPSIPIHTTSTSSSLPASIPPAPFQQTHAALLQHKTQQKQLMELQEKLQLHQRALAQKTHTFHYEKPQSKERESKKQDNNKNESNPKLLKTTVSA